MVELQTAITGNQQAVSAFLAVARTIPPARWSEQPAPGKWSPAELTEHLALTYEAGRGLLQGSFPSMGVPQFLRPLVRSLFLRPILQHARFPKRSKAPKFLRPIGAHPAREALTARLQAAADSFESYVAAADRSGKSTVNHPWFGRLPLAELAQLQMIHTQHHHQHLAATAN